MFHKSSPFDWLVRKFCQTGDMMKRKELTQQVPVDVAERLS